MKKASRFFLLIAFFLVLLVLGANSGFLLSPKVSKEYYIKPGDSRSFYHLSQALERDHIIRSAFLLRLLAKGSGIDKRIQSGYYDFHNHLSTFAILFSLYQGKSKSIALTIVEGYDIYEVAGVLWKKGLVKDKNLFIQKAQIPNLAGWGHQSHRDTAVPFH